MWMARRSLEHEYMDDHIPPQEVIDEVYRFLGAISRWLGGTRATLYRFEELSRGWTVGERITVLDVASGGGDLARALIRWGRDRGFVLRVTALDISLRALDCARRRGPADDQLRFVCADVHLAPCRDGAFDYVTCALFLHHMTDDDVVRTLRAFDRLATRGVVVNDLVRRWRHYAWSWLFTRPFNAVLRHDGPLSVKRAFRGDELCALARRSGMAWLSMRTHFGHRMTLAGERPSRQGVAPGDITKEGPGRRR
ncbi:MAG: methyltransferase domain-containing protein [Acidobacteria bacterium]|nr:MAG: methyltransferase domain-containing protein [Acidobacteriota bacterium]